MARPRLHDDGFLAFLRQQSCIACGKPPPCEAAHIRIGFFAMGKKPDDRDATPLCRACHRDQHQHNETSWWEAIGIDPFKMAAMFYTAYGGTGGTPRKKRKPRVTIKPKGFGGKRKITQRIDPWLKGRKIRRIASSGSLRRSKSEA